MTAQPYLLDVPKAAVPPLVEARGTLDRLQAEHDRILAEAEDAGTDGELVHADEWNILLAALESARTHALCLEASETNTGLP